MVAPLIACHDCDLLQRIPAAASGQRVRCCRCGSVLRRSHHDRFGAITALALTAAVLFVLANVFPLLGFGLQGRYDEAHLIAGIGQLYQQGMPWLGTAVLATTIVLPGLHIALLVYLYVPLSLGRRPPLFAQALRLLQGVLPWSMLEIFLLGTIIASVKLAEQATIIPGVAAWALGVLVVLLAYLSAQVDPRALWRHVG